MLLGKVVGNVWATKKDESLEGLRFLLINPFRLDHARSTEVVVAADPIGAGVGETVIVAFGRAARHAIGRGQDVGYQVAVVGIVDQLSIEGGEPLEL
jgi:ethanolamine utilization protein EutN